MELKTLQGIPDQYLIIDDKSVHLLGRHFLKPVRSDILLYSKVNMGSIKVQGVVLLDASTEILEVGIKTSNFTTTRYYKNPMYESLLHDKLMQLQLRRTVIVDNKGYSLVYYFIPTYVELALTKQLDKLVKVNT